MSYLYKKPRESLLFHLYLLFAGSDSVGASGSTVGAAWWSDPSELIFVADMHLPPMLQFAVCVRHCSSCFLWCMYTHELH